MNSWLAPTDCRVCAAMRERKGSFLFAAALAAVEGAAWIGLLVIGERLLAEASESPLRGPAWLLGAIVAAIVVIRLGRWRLLSNLAFWLDRRLLPGLIDRALTGRLQGQNYAPELLGDTERLKGFLGGRAHACLYELSWIPLAAATALLLAPSVGIVLAFTGIAFALLLVAAERITRPTRYDLDVSAMIARHLLSDAYRHGEDIGAMMMAPAVTARWLGRHDDRTRIERRVAHASQWLEAAGLSVALAAAAALVLFGTPGPGIAGKAAALGLLAMVAVPGCAALRHWRAFGEFREAIARLKVFAMMPHQVREPQPGAPAGNALSVQRVSHGVAPGAPLVLSDISFELPPGEVLAVIGPGGAGKSMLARLLAGATQPLSGSVLLGGREVLSHADDGTSPIGYLRQDVQLFDADIAENIARLGEVDLDAVVAAARAAGVHEAIMALPDRYHGRAGLDGERLPAGLRQRIALARALYHAPALVVLDHPETHLDGDGERALARALQDLKARGTSVVLATHKTSLVRHADKLLVLERGVAVAFGAVPQVLAQLAGRAA